MSQVSVNDICNIWYQQSAVKAGKLWIDGGLVTTYNGSYKRTDYNRQLLSLDLQKNWNDTDATFLQDNVIAFDKLSNSPPVPLRQNGGLYPGSTDDDNIYLLGGIMLARYDTELNYTAVNAEPPAIWVFNTYTNQWTSHTGPNVLDAVKQLPSTGSVVSAPEAALGLFINGQIDSEPIPNFVSETDGSVLAPGMLILNTGNQTAKEVDTTNLNSNATTGGSAVWFANLGTHGMVIRMGGMNTVLQDDSDATIEDFVGFDTVDVLDVSTIMAGNSSIDGVMWHQQQTSGPIPDQRTRFCAVAVSAQDNSSHHVFIYGGREGQQFFDEVYALSLPAFRWTRLYYGNGPRAYHTCHLVGGSKLISVGGLSNDIPNDACDTSNGLALSIYDMNNNNFTHMYTATDQPFEVPAPIYRYIGGDATGGATVTQPEAGFSDAAIEALFASSTSANTTDGSSNQTSSPTNNNKQGSKSHTGAIAGGVVGGVVGLVLVALAVWWYLKKRKPHNELGNITPKTGSNSGAAFENQRNGTMVQNSNVPEHVQDDRNDVRYARPLSTGIQESSEGWDDGRTRITTIE